MMCVNMAFELSMILESEQFQAVFSRVCRRSKSLSDNGDVYVDRDLTQKGITVKYRDSTYKKKVTLIVNAALLPKKSENDPEYLVSKLEKRVEDYFDSEYSLRDFVLACVTFTVDIDVGSRENVQSYIKVLKRIRRVKGFSPDSVEEIDDALGFCLLGNSSKIAFRIYDLRGVLADLRRRFDSSSQELGVLVKETTGLLRVDVILLGKKVIRNFATDYYPSEQIEALMRRSQEIFSSVFLQIIPPGNFCKMPDANKIVQKEVENIKLRRKMLFLLSLIPQKKSLLFAQKALRSYHVDKVMEEFRRLNLSPITLQKRSDVCFLPSLYDFLHDSGR